MSNSCRRCEDISNHIRAVMYVEDIEDIKTSHNRCILKFEDLDQIHIRAVMLMSKTSKI